MSLKTKKVLTILLCVMVGFCATAIYSISVGIANAEKNNQSVIVWSEISLDDEYGFGAEFTIPKRQLSVGDKSVTASSSLEYPSGNATKLEKVTLSEPGRYSIHYSATLSGSTYTTTEKFYVSSRIAEYGENTTISYGKHDLALEAEGLLLRIGEGDKLTFSTVIDLNNVTKDDVLIEGFVTPDRAGAFDFEELFFVFTDVVDPNVTLTIRGRHYALGTHLPYTYWLVGGNGQVLTGYEVSSGGIHRGNRWGTPIVHSFAARDFEFNGGGLLPPDTARFRLTLDTATMCAYVSDTFIADLDDPTYFDNLWGGFSSGRVKLTVYGSMYSSSSANLCLTKVRGIDLTAQQTIDSKGPDITVDVPYDVMPDAKIGHTYPVPSATAHDDIDGECSVTTSVWYNYSSENAVLVPVKDGKFTTSRRGNYVIEYTSEDAFGNKSTKLLVVKSTDSVQNITVETNESTIIANGLCGYAVSIPAPIVNGGSGDAKYQIEVTLNGENIDVVNYEFYPQLVGDYQVTYYVQDFIGQTASCSYTVNVQADDKPVFVEEPILPHVFISGSQYKLPTIYLNDYTSGKAVKKEANISVVDANGERSLASGESYIPVVNNNGDSVKIIYSCDGEKREYLVPTVIVWETISNRKVINLQNYLYMNGATFVANDDSTQVIANGVNEKEGWTFANKILAEVFAMNLSFNDSKLSKCGGLEIMLTDDQNRSNVLKIAFQLKEKSLIVNAGGVEKVISFDVFSGRTLSISYKSGSIIINGTNFAVEKWDNGNKFEGFTSDFIIVSSWVKEAISGASYNVISICGQPINVSRVDVNAPNIYVTGNYGGCVEEGATVVLPRALAGDALDPNSTLTLTVLDPQGNVVKDVNGDLLQNVSGLSEYKIVISSYGKYSITYTASDTFNSRANVRTYTYALVLEDEIAPTLEWTSVVSTMAKIGDVIVMPSFRYSDNITEAENIIIMKYVFNPNGRMVTLSGNSNSIRCDYKGVYQFRVLAMDKAGNLSMICYEITVS